MNRLGETVLDKQVSCSTQVGLTSPLLLPTSPLVGREEFVKAYQAQLEEKRFTVIPGRSGVGKSHVLARLIELYRELPVIGLDCSLSGPDLDSAIWEIAKAINSQFLLDFLDTDRRSPRPYPAVVKLGHLFAHILNLPTLHLVCLDNVHAWYNNKELEDLISRFWTHIQYHAGRNQATPLVILLTQKRPHFLRGQVFKSLSGCTRAELEAILASRGYDLSTEQVTRIHETTQGNPGQAILIAAHLAKDERLQAPALSVEEFAELALQNLVLEEELARCYDPLSHEEKLVLQATSVFTQPISSNTLKTVLRKEAIRYVASHQRWLSNKFLLNKIPSSSYEFTISPLDRVFYLNEADLDVLEKIRGKAEIFLN